MKTAPRLEEAIAGGSSPATAVLAAARVRAGLDGFVSNRRVCASATMSTGTTAASPPAWPRSGARPGLAGAIGGCSSSREEASG